MSDEVVNVVRILLISGSTRFGSTNTAFLRTAESVAPPGVTARLFTRMTNLPHFNPDDDPVDDSAGRRSLHPVVAELRAALGASQAVLLCTPEYAGALPGSFKNLLDWTVGGAEMYGKPVAWVNVSSSATGAVDAHASLARCLGYLKADIVAAACARIPIVRGEVGDDGLIADSRIRERISTCSPRSQAAPVRARLSTSRFRAIRGAPVGVAVVQCTSIRKAIGNQSSGDSRMRGHDRADTRITSSADRTKRCRSGERNADAGWLARINPLAE